MTKLNIHNVPDLTKRPPRSPRVRLGGYVILLRVLDKGRATLAGRNGEYRYNSQLDGQLFAFLGIRPEDLLAELKTGKGDGELLQWIRDRLPHPHSACEIDQWSAFTERFCPGTVEFRERLNTTVAKWNGARDDIRTVFDLLDLDDHASFGGKA
jgi:hypothetical protein